jgi:CheY-like chemotaxis protein
LQAADKRVGSSMTTMLVVEDDPAWRALYREEFGARFTLHEASDALQALALLSRIEPDLIVLDVKLPRMDGLDLLRVLVREGITAPVIVCSGAPPESIPDLGGRARLVQKTADLRYLRGAVGDALGTSWRTPARPVTEPDWLD